MKKSRTFFLVVDSWLVSAPSALPRLCDRTPSVAEELRFDEFVKHEGLGAIAAQQPGPDSWRKVKNRKRAMSNRKTTFSFTSLLLCIWVLGAFGAFGQSQEPGLSFVSRNARVRREQSSLPTQSGNAKDLRSLVGGLRASGLTVKRGGNLSQPFFSVKGRLLSVGREQIQVFQYAKTKTAEREAKHVDPTGPSIGASMPMWIGPPHLYQSGRLIVVYVGSDQSIIKELENLLGPQFAGK